MLPHPRAGRTKSNIEVRRDPCATSTVQNTKESLRRTMSYDREIQPAHLRRRMFASQGRRDSQPEIAWRELNKSLNSLFHGGRTNSSSSPPQVSINAPAMNLQHQESIHANQQYGRRRSPSFSQSSQSQSLRPPLVHYHSECDLRQAVLSNHSSSLPKREADHNSAGRDSGEPSYYKLPSTSSEGEGYMSPGDVYHTVHGLGARRRKALYTSRWNEPFSKIVRHRAPTSMMFTQDLMPSVAEQRTPNFSSDEEEEEGGDGEEKRTPLSSNGSVGCLQMAQEKPSFIWVRATMGRASI